VIAVVNAADAGGAGYELAYDVRVSDAGGRWQVLQIETNPTT
jgi:hypothetical protein